MGDDLERLVSKVYRAWKSARPEDLPHPDEETFVLAMEGRLGEKEFSAFKEHLCVCDACAEMVRVYYQASQDETADVPQLAVEAAARVVAASLGGQAKEEFFEVAVRIGTASLELLRSAGDVLVGREFVPAAALRGRQQTQFSGVLTIVKDCAGLRCQIAIERVSAESIRLTAAVTGRTEAKPVPDIRFTLVRGEIELESRLAEAGSIVFDPVSAGSYSLRIQDSFGRRASVLLEVAA